MAAAGRPPRTAPCLLQALAAFVRIRYLSVPVAGSNPACRNAVVDVVSTCC